MLKIFSRTFYWCFRIHFLNRNSCKMASEVINMSTCFPAQSDIYNGLTVDVNEFTLSPEEFEKALTTSLHEWISIGIRGVWFKVSLGKSSYIPILVQHGFTFHHAKTSYAMLTRWLPADEPNLLPQFPHTHIGVGGMVINDKKQLLAIQEKYNQIKYWKLPGGYSNPGEDFSDTAKREVFEETGIETEFQSVVTLRHHHKHTFNCSDIYVVCHLKPINQKIQISSDEISRCEWIDIQTYRDHPYVSNFNKYVIDAFFESERLKCKIKVSPVLPFFEDQKVYSVRSLEGHD